ncbi:hypothetical protein [Paenibacillus sp. RC84]|uniref:hypothetical protein n=1 Tax=Paenibacillus sp. RC84 TaxID=3156252 RepID=UPI003517F409
MHVKQERVDRRNGVSHSWGPHEGYLFFLLVGCIVFKRFAIFFVVHLVGTSFR